MSYKFFFCSIVDGEDFQQIDDMIVTFGDCQNRSCINITIVDDMVNEPVESFTYTLEMIPGSNSAICLEPVGGEVTIFDDDGRLGGCVPSKFIIAYFILLPSTLYMYTYIWPENNCHFLVLYIDQPKAVTFSTVNATAVSITWSGIIHLSTSLIYTSYSDCGILMTQYIIVLPPSVISTEVTLNDNFAGYEHLFMLQYISTKVTPVTTEPFAFGKYSSYYHIC